MKSHTFKNLEKKMTSTVSAFYGKKIGNPNTLLFQNEEPNLEDLNLCSHDYDSILYVVAEYQGSKLIRRFKVCKD